MRLPLIEYTHSKNTTIDLSEYSMVACQHLLGTLINMIDVLIDQGMKPDNIWIIGKCYSSNREVFKLLQQKGIHVSEDSFSFDPTESYDAQFQTYVSQFLKNALHTISTKKIILLDDGGFLIQSFITLKPRGFEQVSAVEQTTSGFNALQDLSIDFPIINVAKSNAKLSIETPFIAEKTVSEIIKTFKKYSYQDPNILIIGNGTVGSEIAKHLKRLNYQVSACDKLIELCDFEGEYKKRIPEFDVLIGATGKNVLSSVDLVILKRNTLLISVSSSDREFESQSIRSTHEHLQCHDDVPGPNGLRLINCGFPINFNDGAFHCIEPNKIQLTRALLLEGIFQSVKETKSGIIELDTKIQNDLIAKFKKILK